MISSYISVIENICKYIVDNPEEYESYIVCFHEKRKDLLESFSDFLNGETDIENGENE